MSNYSLNVIDNRKAFASGMKDAIPIAAGYFAVAFSLGITARAIGLNSIHCFITSILVHASAGEYAGYTMIKANATYIEMAIMILVANARYLLMSCAMSQRVEESLSFIHRLIMGFGITDEIFGVSIAQKGYINPNYVYGAMITAIPSWALGSAIGCFSGNILPDNIVSALGVALYGMFLAIIIPPARKDRVVMLLIVVSFVLSYIASRLSLFANISGGSKTIILTVVISALAAVIFPHKDEVDD